MVSPGRQSTCTNLVNKSIFTNPSDFVKRAKTLEIWRGMCFVSRSWWRFGTRRSIMNILWIYCEPYWTRTEIRNMMLFRENSNCQEIGARHIPVYINCVTPRLPYHFPSRRHGAIRRTADSSTSILHQNRENYSASDRDSRSWIYGGYIHFHRGLVRWNLGWSSGPTCRRNGWTGGVENPDGLLRGARAHLHAGIPETKCEWGPATNIESGAD